MPRNFISSSQFQRKQKKLGLLSIFKFSLIGCVQLCAWSSFYILNYVPHALLLSQTADNVFCHFKGKSSLKYQVSKKGWSGFGKTMQVCTQLNTHYGTLKGTQNCKYILKTDPDLCLLKETKQWKLTEKLKFTSKTFDMITSFSKADSVVDLEPDPNP
jgi:hypothetical protein